MFLQNCIHKKLLATMLFLLGSLTMMAQDTAAVTSVPSGYNLLAISMIAVTVVLVFVIWGMGQVLIALSRQLLDKEKSKTSIATIPPLLVFLLFSINAMGQNIPLTETIKVIPNYGGLSETTFYFLVAVILTEITTILFIFLSVRRIYTELLPAKAKAVAAQSKLTALWIKLDKKLLTKAIPIEREADYLLDHNYDGIQELDNALPPWWKYGFIITIGVAIIYFFHFVVGDGKNPTQEYQEEMAYAQAAKEEYDANNKDKIDAANVPLADVNGIKMGKEYFMANCIACHGANGEGGAGPNLTDNYWLHKGSLNDIYTTITKGYPDKGMQSWAVKFSPKEISQIASFVTTLKGTNPANPKAPQGDIFVPVGGLDSAKKTTVAFTSIK